MRALVLTLIVTACSAPPLPDIMSEPIRPEMLEAMFANMRGHGWNVDGPLVWGYFFTSQVSTPLEAAASELAAAGYRRVDLWQDAESGIFWLHVEKVEAHTIESLLKRNTELTSLAARYGLDSYDGMDAGPPRP